MIGIHTFRQFLRQTQQQEDENLRHELDQELDSIRSLLFAPPPAEPAADASTSASVPAQAVPVPDDDKEYDQYEIGRAHV